MAADEGLEKLVVWRKAMEFAVWVCRDVLCLLPREEQYALVDQLRRSAQSIPANIAEGYGRYNYQDNIHFCYIARGSLEETRSHLLFAHEMKYLSADLETQAEQMIDELHRLISGYINYLKASRPGTQARASSAGESSETYDISSPTHLSPDPP